MLYIVTAVHNRRSITQEFILNIKEQTYSDWKLLIVDDGSTDGTSEMIVSEDPTAIVIHGNGKLWWGGSLNKAYKWLLSNASLDDYVYICNDDIRIPQDYIEKGIEILEREENDILITGTGFDSNTGDLSDGATLYDVKTGSEKILDVDSEGNCGSTHSLFFRISTFKKIGGFHPVLLPHYGSDPEFIIRANKKGIPIKSYRDLVYVYDKTATGIKKAKKITFEVIFSKRSIYNPFYWFTFVCLTTPIKYIPKRIFTRITKSIRKIRG